MNTTRKIFIGFFAILSLTACEKRVVVETAIHKVKVLEIDPPKHYYVKFQDIVTGEVVNEKIKKKCSSYRKIHVGETYELQVQVSENSKRQRFTEYPNKVQVFCPA
jgi:hypothetical protein